MSLRADVLLGYVGGGYNGSSNAQHVIACNTFGCSPTAENTRITYEAGVRSVIAPPVLPRS